MLSSLRGLVESARGHGALSNMLVRLCSVGLAFITMIILGRHLGSAGYGLFAGAVSIANLGAFFSRLGIEPLLVQRIAAAQSASDWPVQRGVLRFGFAQTAALAALPIAILFTVRATAPQLLGDYVDVALFSIALILPMALTSVVQGALRGYMRYVIAFVPAFILVHAAQLAMLVALIALAMLNTTNALIACSLAWWAAVVLALLILNRTVPAGARKPPTHYHGSSWFKSSLFGALGLTSTILIGQADIFLVGVLGDPAEAGRYAAGQRIAWLLMIPVTAVYAGLSPLVASLFAARDTAQLASKIRHGARTAFFVALAMALALSAVGPYFFAFLGDDFASSFEIFLILAGGLCASLIFGRAFEVLLMTGHSRAAGLLSFGAVLLNALADVVLIPLYGALGVALATAVILPAQSLLLAIVAFRLLGLRCDIVGSRRLTS